MSNCSDKTLAASYSHTMNKNRSHLVPTSIVNKNGVRTTVHRKPDAGPVSSTKLPKATLRSTRQRREQLERDTAESLATQTGTFLAKTYEKLLAAIPDYSDATLHRFAAAATTDLGWNLNEFICNARPSEAYVNDWITTRPTAIKENIDTLHIIQGLCEYKHLEPQQHGHYPQRRIEQITALIRVSAHLGNTGHGIAFGVNKDQGLMLHIEDEKLSDLLTTHENPSAIADLIVTRNITNAEQLTALYKESANTAKAINKGVL